MLVRFALNVGRLTINTMAEQIQTKVNTGKKMESMNFHAIPARIHGNMGKQIACTCDFHSLADVSNTPIRSNCGLCANLRRKDEI